MWWMATENITTVNKAFTSIGSRIQSHRGTAVVSANKDGLTRRRLRLVYIEYTYVKLVAQMSFVIT